MTEQKGPDKEYPTVGGVPLREVIREGKKAFSVVVRSNKASRYVTLPSSLIVQHGIEVGDTIELVFTTIEIKARGSITKKEDKNQKKIK